MGKFISAELQEALPPLVSLIGKCEKALGRLAAGRWQHAMLNDNLKALRAALALINNETGKAADLTQEDLREMLRALSSMIGKTEKAQAGFSAGTSQHTLLQNRLKALCIAETLLKRELNSRSKRAD